MERQVKHVRRHEQRSIKNGEYANKNTQSYDG